MNTIEPIANDNNSAEYNMYYRRALRQKLAHRLRMIELSVRNELYRQDNNAKQNRLIELEDQIRHLSAKWADDAYVIETLKKGNVSTWPRT